MPDPIRRGLIPLPGLRKANSRFNERRIATTLESSRKIEAQLARIGGDMSVNEHLTTLLKKHDDLSKQVERAQQNPSANHLDITAMKKRKLMLKEKIVRLSEA